MLVFGCVLRGRGQGRFGRTPAGSVSCLLCTRWTGKKSTHAHTVIALGVFIAK